MGTNYYRVNIPTEDDIQEMHRLIDERRFESERGNFDSDGKIIPSDAITCVQDLIDNCTKEIHICKTSFGWKTCFDHNWGKYYMPKRASLERFLQEPNTIIKDEYGEVFSYEDFWKMIDTRDNIIYDDGRELFVSKTYMEWERTRNPKYTEYICKAEAERCEKEFGVTCECNDFESDGLRFSVFSDFS